MNPSVKQFSIDTSGSLSLLCNTYVIDRVMKTLINDYLT